MGHRHIGHRLGKFPVHPLVPWRLPLPVAVDLRASTPSLAWSMITLRLPSCPDACS